MTSAESRGTFVTLEGPDGSGKTTQIALLADRLRQAGRAVVITREPGGTPFGERVRDLLLGTDAAGIDPRTEVLLFCAARTELVTRVVVPALAAGRIVVCDRYADATLAYQGYGRGVDLAWISALGRTVTGGLVPDRTVLLDLPVETGLARRPAAEWNRLDAASLAFHRRVRAGYLALADREPRRWVVVAADRPRDDVAADVLAALGDLPGLDFAGAAATHRMQSPLQEE